VYSEIVGVIKGSSEALKCTGHHLSRDQYLWGLARRVSAQLDVETRAQIYYFFEQYEKVLGARHELDPADRWETTLLIILEFSFLDVRTRCLLEFLGQVTPKKLSDFYSYDSGLSDSDKSSQVDADDSKANDLTLNDEELVQNMVCKYSKPVDFL
jgi:hypothetical protein